MSGFYIGVDGKARKVKGGYIGIDGKARKIKKGYIGVNGVARLCWSSVDPVFANNSWEDIALACQTGSVPDSWAVGDQKTITINDFDYTIDIIGKNHDYYADGSGKAPLTFQLHETFVSAYAMHNSNTNSCGWESSQLRTSRLNLILSWLPEIIQSSIREVNKLTSAGNKSSNLITTSDKLFLLSEVEVFGTLTSSFSGEGTQYEYYQTRSKVKQRINRDESANWWMRSPDKSSTNRFCRVNNNGNPDYDTVTTTNYFAPAFCF